MDNILNSSQELQDILLVSGIKAKGYGILPKYPMLDTDLSIQAKGIYSYFCSYTGSGNTAFPGRDKILKDLQLSKDGYYKHFKLLTEQGYITVTQEQTNKFLRNVYTIEPQPKKFVLDENDTAQTKAYSKVRIEGLESLGYGMIPKLVMIDERLDIKAKAIYAYFCVFTGSGQNAYPKLKNILFHLGIVNDTYYKHFNTLLKLNYIKAEQRQINGKLSVNDYYLISNPNLANAPLPKKQDTEKTAYLSRSAPLPKKQDTITQDTITQDTENQDTNSNSTDITSFNNSIYNINQSIHQQTAATPPVIPAEPVRIEGMSDDEKENIVFDEMLEAETLPYWYISDESRLTAAIHIITGYRQQMKWFKNNENSRDDLKYSAFVLFNNALIEMLTTKNLMKLKGANISYSKVYAKLIEYLVYEEKNCEFHIISLLDTAIGDFMTACRDREILNHMQYMKACIWNVMQVGEIGIHAKIAHDFPALNR